MRPPLVTFNCEFKENELLMKKEMGAVAAEMLNAAGFEDVNVRNEISFPGKHCELLFFVINYRTCQIFNSKTEQ